MKLAKINRRAQGFQDYKLIAAIIVMLVVAVAIYGLVRFGVPDTLKNVIPGFEDEKLIGAGDANSQPAELRNEDPCIDYGFFWTNEKNQDLNGKIVEEGKVFIAIAFKSDIGDLNKADNPKYFCREYALLVKEITSNYAEPYYFRKIFSRYSPPKEIEGKKYYFIQVDVKDAGFGKSGQYSFSVVKDYASASKFTLVRKGFQLHVEHDVRGIPLI